MLVNVYYGGKGKAMIKKKITAKAKQSSKDSYCVLADWKDIEGLATRFGEAFHHFGFFVYPLPSCEGSDAYGFLISRDRLTVKQVRELDFNPK